MGSFYRLGAGLWVLLGTLLLLSAALYNGFPLVTSDTGAYIDSGMRMVVPIDRPISYGLFLRLVSFKHSLWFVVVAQSLLLAALLFRYISVFAPRVTAYPLRLALVGGVTWATGLAWFSGQLMPDIFTSIGVLALALICLAPLQLAEKLAWSVVVMLSALMHSSNLLTFTLLVLLTGAVAWFTGALKTWLKPAGIGVALAAVLLSWVILPGLHAACGGDFAINRGAPVFLMGKLVETGLLDRYLDEHCGEENLALCQYRGKLPDNAVSFVWGEPNIPNQMGGWETSREEYKRIINGVLTTPRYYPLLLEEGVLGTVRQLTHVGHGDGLTPFLDGSNPFWKVQAFFGYELKEYTSSLQNRGALNFKELTERSYNTLALTLLAALLLLLAPLRQAVPPVLWMTVVLVALAVVLNAAVTANLANVLDRLQTRMAWLLPWTVLLVWLQAWPQLRPQIQAWLTARFAS